MSSSSFDCIRFFLPAAVVLASASVVQAQFTVLDTAVFAGHHGYSSWGWTLPGHTLTAGVLAGGQGVSIAGTSGPLRTADFTNDFLYVSRWDNLNVVWSGTYTGEITPETRLELTYDFDVVVASAATEENRYYWRVDLRLGDEYFANLASNSQEGTQAVSGNLSETYALYSGGAKSYTDAPWSLTLQIWGIGGVYSGGAWDDATDSFTYHLPPGGLEVMLTPAAAIPEPAHVAVGLGALALAGAIGWRRRRGARA